MATKVVEAKVEKPKASLRKSKGVEDPWQVWEVGTFSNFHHFDEEFPTKKKAEEYIKNNSDLVCPVIVHVDIPKMEY